MKIEDFGFTPVVGEEYVVTFTSNGDLLSSSNYNGADLPPVSFPDQAQISFSVTDKTTGKHLMSTDFISYNGKLYKATFKLPLKNVDSNKNANIYIKELHYDLTTGSVLIQVQGFEGESYQLTVSDKDMSHEVAAMPITLDNNMFYSIPTELLQGAVFEVHLFDQHGKSIDVQEFTAPISTDWRHTETVDDGSEVTLDGEEQVVGEAETANTEPSVEEFQQDNFNPGEASATTQQSTEPPAEQGKEWKEPVIYGGIALVAVLVLILIVRILKRRRADKMYAGGRQPDEYAVYGDVSEDELMDPDRLEEVENGGGYNPNEHPFNKLEEAETSFNK